MSQSITPYPLNPNLSCVERVRRMFLEINKRRLVDTARVRPDDARVILDWIQDNRNNILPCFVLTDEPMRELWTTIHSKPPVQDFLLSLCYEMRMRCFEDPTDFDSFLDSISTSITQFSDQLSYIEDTLFSDLSDSKAVLDTLAGNVWVIPIMLYEQFSLEELSIRIIDDEIVNTKAKGAASDAT